MVQPKNVTLLGYNEPQSIPIFVVLELWNLRIDLSGIFTKQTQHSHSSLCSLMHSTLPTKQTTQSYTPLC